MGRVAWGKGKREVLALKAEILALLASGATLGEAHKTLQALGKLSVGYTAFTIHVKAIRGSSPSREAGPGSGPVPVEPTPEILAWFANRPRGEAHSAESKPAPPTQSASLHSLPAPQRRTPPGAGVEPQLRKFNYRPGERNHWDGESTESNQGDDSK